nr:disease resistance protein RPP13-like isoform X6 [Ipomoea batatas]
MRFEWEKINILSKLPRLEVLKLGKEWKMQEEVIFCELIALYISECNLKHWKASSHNFPKLEHLYLRGCRILREIPVDFAEISTLKSINLCNCLPSAVESAKKIQDEQHDSGNSDMVAIELEYLMAIKLLECLPSAVESAKKIQDEQRDYGNNDMVVIEEDTLDGSKSEKSLSEEESEEDN